MQPFVFDSTALDRWNGPPVGIARVVSNLRNHLSKKHPHFLEVALNESNEFVVDGPSSSVFDNLKRGIFFTAGFNWDYDGHTEAIRQITEKGLSVATLLYDAIPVLYPHSFGPGFGGIYEKWLNEAIDYSDKLLAISESTRNDIANLYSGRGVQRSDISVVRLGDEIQVIGTKDPGEVSWVSELGEYVLSVGMIEFRKNHVVLLDAYRLLLESKKTDLPRLVIVGREGWMNHAISYQVAHDPRLSRFVSVINSVSDVELDALYRNCLFTVYPSLYEGWGLPVAESLKYGKPSIVSRSSSIVEIAPEITRFAHPLKATQWAAEIDELISDRELLESETTKVVNNYLGTSWAATADQVLSACVCESP